MADNKLFKRFWSKVLIINDEASCWEWQAMRFSNGYGSFRKSTKIRIVAHRMAYELWSGDIGNELLEVMHGCNNRGCVRPSHLSLGSHQENLLTRRTPSGESHYRTKLTWKIVKAIRAEYKASYGAGIRLARKWDISPAALYPILSGDSWREGADSYRR